MRSLRRLALAALSLLLACEGHFYGPRRDAGALEGGLAEPDAEPAPDAARDAGAPEIQRYFPESAFMYQPITDAPVDPDSWAITRWLHQFGGFGWGELRVDFSLQVLSASDATPRHNFELSDEFEIPDCDPAPFPVPVGGALAGEAGYACEHDGNCQLIVVDRQRGRLYEMWRANIVGEVFRGGCAAVWDMTRVYGPEGRGEQCASADAAGLPIAPLTFSADEVAGGSIDHAIRFVLPNHRIRAGAYQHPGNYARAPSGPEYAPIYGSRWRLRGNFNLSSLPNEGARVVARALQRYGMVLAAGGDIALTAQSDRFSEHEWEGLLGARDLVAIKPGDFEILDTGEPIELTYECERTPIVD